MGMRWHDREEAAALLAGIAALRLGGERAAAIDDELRERAGQLWRLAREPLALGDEPAWDADAVQEAASGDLPEGFAAVRSGRPAAVEVFAACRDRIQRLDPTLRAWAALDLDAAERTSTAAATAGATAQRPLAGVPVGIKDVFATAGLPTRAGSALLADRLAATASDGPAGDGGDAPAVARLRQAGAVLVGKTACTELALNDPAPTRNPWDPTRTPGGSSAGSAVAVASGMCLASLDTQTAGDILRPAAYNGVVGFKPTYGTIPRQGVVPVAWSIDTVGVQTRRVQDAALLFAVLAGRHARGAAAGTVGGPDGWTWQGPPRLGLVRDPLLDRADAQAQAATTQAVAVLRGAGAQTSEVWLDGALELAHAAHRVVTFCECAAVHEELLDRHAEQLGPKARTLLELGAVTPATGYLRAQRLRRRLAARLQASFQQEGVDALVTPTATGPAPADLATTGDSSLQLPWTFVGLPAISLPAGLGETGMPLAVQLIGAPGADERLLAVARWCEQALNIDLHPPLA